MRTFILSFLFLFPLISKAQTNLTQDYTIYAYNREDTGNKNDYHIWLYDGESYTMNFPRTVFGLQNIIEKADYIAKLSGLNSHTTDNSIGSDSFKNQKDYKILFRLISERGYGIFKNYIIGNRVMNLMCTDSQYSISISDR